MVFATVVSLREWASCRARHGERTPRGERPALGYTGAGRSGDAADYCCCASTICGSGLPELSVVMVSSV